MTVYFMRAGDTGPIKIGSADDVDGRLRELQCGNHHELIVIRTVAGGRPLERWFHRHFSAYRIRGEWFSFCDEMLSLEPPIIATSRPSLLWDFIDSSFSVSAEA